MTGEERSESADQDVDSVCLQVGHDDRVVDEESGHWMCNRCGAEGWN